MGEKTDRHTRRWQTVKGVGGNGAVSKPPSWGDRMATERDWPQQRANSSELYRNLPSQLNYATSRILGSPAIYSKSCLRAETQCHFLERYYSYLQKSIDISP